MKSHSRQLRIMPTAGSRSGTRAGHKGKRPSRGRISAAQFREARRAAGFDRQQAADFVGVSLRTVGHWETGKARPTHAAFRLLRIVRGGELGLLDPDWAGYRLIRGRLVTPEDRDIRPGDLSWLSLLVRQAHEFRHLMRERRSDQEPCSGGAKRVEASRSPSRVRAARPSTLDGGASARNHRETGAMPVVLIGATNGRREYSPMPRGRNTSHRSAAPTGRRGPCSNTGQNQVCAGGVV